jgi:hypothetical protein
MGISLNLRMPPMSRLSVMSAVAVALKNRRKQQEQAGGLTNGGRVPFVVPKVGFIAEISTG